MAGSAGIGVQNNSDHIFCFSHLRWQFVYQRPQHLMDRAAREYNVWYFEEPLFHDQSPSLKIDKQASGVSVVTPLLPHGLDEAQTNATLQSLLVNLLSRVQPRRLVAWYYTPMALRFTQGLAADCCVYDNMDELSTFAAAPKGIVELEERLMSQCDVVFVGGHSLFAAKRERHHNIYVFPSSVDTAHFGAARTSADDAEDQSHLPRPRLGFFGVIDERMDIELVEEVSRLRPNWQIIMIGPTAKIDPSTLPRPKNIHWLGCKSYSDLPKYLAGWDVGIMPFAINEATRFISPTKTPEFLAAGVPVVSTPIRDVVKPYGLSGEVEIAADAQSFVERAEILMRRSKGRWLKAVDAHLAGMSWDSTWAGMREQLGASQTGHRMKVEARGV